MLTNAQMKEGRFLRWHKARQRLTWIQARLSEGYTVQCSTYLCSIRYKAKHADMFKATKTGVFLQRGKNWDCIDGCKIEAF